MNIIRTGKCVSTSFTSLTREALGSSNEIATIFQSSSPSSIMAKAAKGFTLRTSPILARLSPISTTSTGGEKKGYYNARNALLSHICLIAYIRIKENDEE